MVDRTRRFIVGLGAAPRSLKRGVLTRGEGTRAYFGGRPGGDCKKPKYSETFVRTGRVFWFFASSTEIGAGRSTTRYVLSLDAGEGTVPLRDWSTRLAGSFTHGLSLATYAETSGDGSVSRLGGYTRTHSMRYFFGFGSWTMRGPS